MSPTSATRQVPQPLNRLLLSAALAKRCSLTAPSLQLTSPRSPLQPLQPLFVSDSAITAAPGAEIASSPSISAPSTTDDATSAGAASCVAMHPIEEAEMTLPPSGA
eukprot:4559650-Pleurochrysis_carterae.AAC.1